MVPDGTEITDVGSLSYLGGLISSSGRADSEVSRKIGCAQGDFRQLQRLWGHSGVRLSDKLRYFDCFVLARLSYGLSSTWLVSAQRRRLDGFHARCLRRILRIPAAYISRVSNEEVRQRAGVIPLSETILKRQLYLLRKVAISPQGDPLREDTFRESSILPQAGRYVRKIGRPRQEWCSELLKVGAERWGMTAFQNLLSDTDEGADERWRHKLDQAFKPKISR